MLLRITTTLFMALALVAPSLHADHHESKQGKVSALMARIESNALDMREQAARLRTYNRAPQLHSWEIHADELGRISAELGNISALVKDLKPMKPFMTFRQNTAFNHIVTLSGAVSTVTGNAIKLVTGTENLRFEHVSQTVVVEARRSYQLTAMARSEGVTTDEGLRIEARIRGQGMLASTEPIRGTTDLTEIVSAFTVPNNTGQLELVLSRRRSQRIDSKVRGTVWLDALKLE